MGSEKIEYFAVSPPGLEATVSNELNYLGISKTQVANGGVSFLADDRLVARTNLWLRTASRVLRRVGRFHATHPAQLYQKTARLPWSEVLQPDVPLRIRVTCRKSRIYHSGAAEERIRKAISAAVDQKLTTPILDGDGDATNPFNTVIARIEKNECTLSVDSSGEHLHRRNYRLESAKAPLRENLAAAALLACGWCPSEHFGEEVFNAFSDPMCGAGTLAIEAAMIAKNIAPGLNRSFAFQNWPGFDSNIFEEEHAAAKKSVKPDLDIQILASDRDAGAVAITQRNAERAGVADHIQVRTCSLSDVELPEGPGLLLCNPPYGHRVGKNDTLRNLYASLGQMVRPRLNDWKLGLITSSEALARYTGLRLPRQSAPIPHGGLKIRVYQSR